MACAEGTSGFPSLSFIQKTGKDRLEWEWGEGPRGEGRRREKAGEALLP